MISPGTVSSAHLPRVTCISYQRSQATLLRARDRNMCAWTVVRGHRRLQILQIMCRYSQIIDTIDIQTPGPRHEHRQRGQERGQRGHQQPHRHLVEEDKNMQHTNVLKSMCIYKYLDIQKDLYIYLRICTWLMVQWKLTSSRSRHPVQFVQLLKR